MTWFNLLKRNRPRKNRNRKPVDIMGGERLKPNERIKSIEEEGHAPKGTSRTMGRGTDLPLNRNVEGKKLIEEKKTRLGTSMAQEGEVQYGIKGFNASGRPEGKEKKKPNSNLSKFRCIRCKKKVSLGTKKYVRDGKIHSKGSPKENQYCRRCAEDMARRK